MSISPSLPLIQLPSWTTSRSPTAYSVDPLAICRIHHPHTQPSRTPPPSLAPTLHHPVTTGTPVILATLSIDRLPLPVPPWAFDSLLASTLQTPQRTHDHLTCSSHPLPSDFTSHPCVKQITTNTPSAPIGTPQGPAFGMPLGIPSIANRGTPR